jgi:hypothetical protein
VIKDGIFVAEFDHITDKYGGPLKNDEVFHNPLSDVLSDVVETIAKEHEKKSE